MEGICSLQSNAEKLSQPHAQRGVCSLHVIAEEICVCVRHRATTCYLVQRRIDMLPKALTEDICSLRANVERLAFSAIWEMTQDAQVIGVR